MAWTIIPDSDIDPDSPVTTGLMTALRDNVAAVANGDSGAPPIKPSSALGSTITTEGSQSIAATVTYTPSAGFYNLVSSNAANSNLYLLLSLYVSSAWRGENSTGNAALDCSALMDGTNQRIKNINGSSTSVLYWQRFDG